MTPVALRFARQLCLPAKDRDAVDAGGLSKKLSDAHCFDMTDARDLMNEVGYMLGDIINANHGDLSSISERGFLPAPKTWIEWVAKGKDRKPFGRVGYLIEDQGDRCLITEGLLLDGEGPCSSELLALPFGKNLRGTNWTDGQSITARQDLILTNEAMNMAIRLWAALTIINTPKLIGRVTHLPHRGLERQLIAQQDVIGKYPLHAWSEIKLSAHPKYLDEEGREVEAHLTGRKCLHFCRAHLRIRRGRLELVNSHWRGDPALGIKRSRYRVTA